MFIYFLTNTFADLHYKTFSICKDFERREKKIPRDVFSITKYMNDLYEKENANANANAKKNILE